MEACENEDIRTAAIHCLRFGRFAPSVTLAAMTIALGLVFSWRTAGWALLAVAGLWALSIVRPRGNRRTRSRPFVVTTTITAVVGALLLLVNGGVPLRGCGSAETPAARDSADAFVQALATGDRNEAKQYLAQFYSVTMPIVATPMSEVAARSVVRSGARESPGGLCGSGVCFIYDLPVQTTADLRTAEYGSAVIVGLGCHSGSWKVDSTGHAS